MFCKVYTWGGDNKRGLKRLRTLTASTLGRHVGLLEKNAKVTPKKRERRDRPTLKKKNKAIEANYFEEKRAWVTTDYQALMTTLWCLFTGDSYLMFNNSLK